MLRMNEMVMYFMLENHQSKALSYQEVSSINWLKEKKKKRKKRQRKGASKYAGCVLEVHHKLVKKYNNQENPAK